MKRNNCNENINNKINFEYKIHFIILSIQY